MLRLALDLNVFVADILARQHARPGSAATMLVDAVRDGNAPSGPVQLIVSVPMLENFANVLARRFGYTPAQAQERADLLHAYACEGPVPVPPFIAVGAGVVPFETEDELRRSIAAFTAGKRAADKLFHETRDDRYVLETALAGDADLLVTTNLSDFNRGDAIGFVRDDAIVYPFARKKLVVSTPAFAAFWLRQGIVPDWNLIAARPAEFVRKKR